MNVLNPRLYAALQQKYGDVGVVNPGEQARLTRSPKYWNGKPRMEVAVTGGESYKVRCRTCRDWKPRLVFNYLWGTRDSQTDRQLLHLAHCFNEDCLGDWESRCILYESLMTGLRRRRGRRRLDSPVLIRSESPPLKPKKLSLPESCIPVCDLPRNHPAREYLESREFDLDELSELWHVCYCSRDPESSPEIFQRIIIPIYRQKDRFALDAAELPDWQLAGWQARSLTANPASKFPKYLSAAGMPKSSLLYGLPHSLDGDGPVAITEGVTDVWRLGGDAVATFGKSMSTQQENHIVSLFQGRPLVVAYDQDAVEERKKVCTRLRNARASMYDEAPVKIVRLRKKRKDIGDCTREEAKQMIYRAAGW